MHWRMDRSDLAIGVGGSGPRPGRPLCRAATARARLVARAMRYPDAYPNARQEGPGEAVLDALATASETPERLWNRDMALTTAQEVAALAATARAEQARPHAAAAPGRGRAGSQEAAGASMRRASPGRPRPGEALDGEV
jgi:hypothetical protein